MTLPVARLYHVISGTTTAYRAPELIRALQPLTSDLITVLTPGATRVISPRVVSMERTNMRDVTRAEVPDPIDLVVCDASFIGLRTVLDRKSTRLNSSHVALSRMPSSA